MNGTSDRGGNQDKSNETSVPSNGPIEPVDLNVKIGVEEQQVQQTKIHTSVTNEKERARHDDLIDRINKSERLMIGLTAIIALTGIWGGYVIYEQLKVTEGQLTEMHSGSADTKTIAQSAKIQADNAQKLADATETFAQATKDSVAQSKTAMDVAIETSRIEQRAWIGVKRMDAVVVQPGKPIWVRITLENSGRTPAIKTKTHFALHPSDQPIDADLFAKSETKRMKQENLHQSVSTVLPGAQPAIELGTNSPVTESEIAQISKRKMVVYLVGEVFYWDVFGKKHRTEICGMLNHTGAFAACDQHNYAD